MRKPAPAVILMLLFCGLLPVRGQDPDTERIQKLFQDAILNLGGDTYLKVTDMVSNGNYFQFDRDGNSSGLIKFDDWTKLPDKSRFELGNKKKERDVTVFNLEKNQGWILEGQKDTRDASPSGDAGFQGRGETQPRDHIPVPVQESRHPAFLYGGGRNRRQARGSQAAGYR